MTDPTIADVARNAAWLADRYDPGHDAIHFRETPRDEHRRATFLTDEHLAAGARRLVVRRADALAAALPPGPIHFIFHSAFCASTLLARAVDVPGVAMGLKEPVILNDMIGWKLRGGGGAEIARALDAAMALLARPFAPGEATVVKPSNVVNGLATAMLAMRPDAKALLLHAPLRVYLGSIARKGMWGRLWVRDLLVKQLREGLLAGLGFEPEDFLAQTDLQVAAAGWLAQHRLFASLAERFGPRVRTLDSETLVARPADTMTALAALYGLPLDAAAIAAIVAGPAFTTNSKDGVTAFGRADRAEATKAEAAYADEIDKVAVWAETVAAGAGVPLALPAPLLD